MSSLLYSILLKMVINVTFFLKTIPLRIGNFIQVKILGKSKRYIVIENHTGALSADSLAVFAIFPRSGTLRSTLRMIETFSRNNVHVVCVINKSRQMEQFVQEIKQLSCDVTIISRDNIGRDFGAYQAGFNFILQKKLEFNYLYFINDSIIYPPKFSEEFQKFSEDDSIKWKCLFINTEHYVHAQSFFLRFSAEIAKSRTFTDFWKSYYPTFQRRKTIRLGEQKLSEILLRDAILPIPFYSSDRTSRSFIKQLNRDDLIALLEKSDLTRIWKWEEDEEFLFTRVSDIFAKKNPTHLLGLPLTRTLGAPLKLDLLKNWAVQCSVAGIKLSLTSAGLSDEETSEVIHSMISQGTTATFTNLRKLWSMHGLI